MWFHSDKNLLENTKEFPYHMQIGMWELNHDQAFIIYLFKFYSTYIMFVWCLPCLMTLNNLGDKFLNKKKSMINVHLITNALYI